MSRVPTMMIETDNGPVVINVSAFDPETMKAHGAEPTPITNSDGLRMDGPTIAEFLTAGYLAENYPPEGYAARSTPEEIAAATKQPETPTPKEPEQPKEPATTAQQMLVTKKGRKFLVVDDKAAPIERDGIDASGYATEADAWTAIMALQG